MPEFISEEGPGYSMWFFNWAAPLLCRASESNKVGRVDGNREVISYLQGGDGFQQLTSWGVESFVRTQVFRKRVDIRVRMSASTPYGSSSFFFFFPRRSMGPLSHLALIVGCKAPLY